MASLLEGAIADIAYKALRSVFLDATLTRDSITNTTDYEASTTTTTTSYSCKAIEDQWSRGVLSQGLVDATDIRILILANSLSVTPQPMDRITIRGKTVTVVPIDSRMQPVSTDPARATWVLRCRG